MAKIDRVYFNALQYVIKKGEFQNDPNRKGIRRLNIPFYNMEFDLRDGFPILTTKKMWFKGIVGETLNCLKGPINLEYLHENKIHVWDGDLLGLDFTPHIYGDVWRNWKNPDGTTTDQLQNTINKILNTPLASDLIIFGDNPSTWKKGVIKSCMNMMQFSCTESGFIDLSINYRSNDAFLGNPWNITQYSLVLHIIGKLTNKTPRFLFLNARNFHIYEPHLDAVKEQLSRDIDKHPNCQLDDFGGFKMDMRGDVDQWLSSKDISDFKLVGYDSYPAITAEMLPYNN